VISLETVEKHDAIQRMTEALEIVMQTKKFSKINVTDIANESGVSRQTFYRHFRDIYDMVNCIHTKRTQLSIDIFNENSDVVESLFIIFKMMKRYKKFYRYAITLEGPNSFSDYYSKAFIHSCKNHIGKANLDKEVLFALDFWAAGTTKLIVDWIRNDMEMPPDTFAAYLYRCIPNNLKRFYI
jgi:AraC-like DNA-binding protein